MLENMNRVQKSRTTILILFYLYFVNCQSHVDKHRLTYTNVRVNGNLCKRFGSDVFTIQDVTTFQCSSPIRGRTVKISRHYPNCLGNDNYTLNLCEVQVWVCSKGWYGHDCNSACSGHCSNNAACDRYDGSCPQGCISGWHGSRCDNSCPQNCVGACNQSSGVCFVCSKGWYGHDCNSACSGHCSNNVACDRYDGSCPQGCISGWHGSKCDNSCPQNCVGACIQSSGVCFECIENFYGHNCTRTCGHCAEGGICDLTNGSCRECEHGWEPPLCQKAAGQSNSEGSAVGVIVGSVIGIVVVLSAVVLLTLVYRRNSLRKQSTSSSVRPPLDADLTDLQVQYSPGHTEEEIHSQDVQCLNSTYDTLDRNALYENTQKLPIYSQLLIDKRNNQQTSK